MAEAKKDVAASSAKNDPTITSDAGEAFPEGTHPARKPSEVTHAADRLEYAEREDKPDPSSVAQVQVLTGDEATGS